MIRPLPIFLLAVSATLAAAQGSVKVEPTTLQGPRPLARQTETSAIRDYLEAWQNLSAALDQNRPDLLSEGFVGTAMEKFTATIDEQSKLGLHARYQVRSHDIKIIFYSPEGLSIQLVDNIEYDEQLLNQEKVLATQPMHARYVAVLTPTEVRWKVRVLQAESQ
ncbi:MAG: hypothetical protein WB524_23995 [Acidobacteriaceae bacterium]|jgi:hypothetical protein